MEDLVESRKKILKMADWIIPGHGKVFKNKRGLSGDGARKTLFTGPNYMYF